MVKLVRTIKARHQLVIHQMTFLGGNDDLMFKDSVKLSGGGSFWMTQVTCNRHDKYLARR